MIIIFSIMVTVDLIDYHLINHVHLCLDYFRDALSSYYERVKSQNNFGIFPVGEDSNDLHDQCFRYSISFSECIKLLFLLYK